MSDKVKKQVTVAKITKLTDDVYSMWLMDRDLASQAKPGQFVSLYCKDQSRLLPRPISICEVDEHKSGLRLVYRVIGDGTKEFSELTDGDTVEVLGTLGNGFTIEGTNAVLIAGGIGIPPMLELAKTLKMAGISMTIVLGYRDTVFLNNEFETLGRVVISTEDGSLGTKGNVIDAIREQEVSGDIIYSCGPIPMLRGVKQWAKEQGIKAQLSLEEKMACGIGACLACVCKSTNQDSHSMVNNKRICKDGPVFDAEEVTL